MPHQLFLNLAFFRKSFVFTLVTRHHDSIPSIHLKGLR
jgi:hypothetical protein